jgi:hypothetical protein
MPIIALVDDDRNILTSVSLERIKIILRRAALKDSYKDGYNTEGLSTKVLEQGQLLIDPERHACT